MAFALCAHAVDLNGVIVVAVVAFDCDGMAVFNRELFCLLRDSDDWLFLVEGWMFRHVDTGATFEPVAEAAR